MKKVPSSKRPGSKEIRECVKTSTQLAIVVLQLIAVLIGHDLGSPQKTEK